MMDTAVEPEVISMRDCLGGERVVEVELAEGLRREPLERLTAVDGTLLILDSLPRPFARFDRPGFFLLTGILGERRVRFTMRLAHRESATQTALEVARELAT